MRSVGIDVKLSSIVDPKITYCSISTEFHSSESKIHTSRVITSRLDYRPGSANHYKLLTLILNKQKLESMARNNTKPLAIKREGEKRNL